MTVPQETRANATDIGTVVILCGEDEVRDVIAYWFSSLPVPTIVAEDGHHAARVVRGGACRLLVTDRVLPPWPGLDTMRELRERHPLLRVAYVDNGNVHDRIVAGLVGATDVLYRPLRRQAVIETLPRADAA